MRFSVVVPTHGRLEGLDSCLAALVRMDSPPGGFEIVVVDDASPVDYLHVVDKYLGLAELRVIRLVRNSGPATARTFGAREARADILAFTDDDCLPDAGWLVALERSFPDDPGDLAVGGLTINAHPTNVFSTATQNLLDFLFSWYNSDAQSARFFPTLNLACGRAHFLRLGGFDPDFPLAAAEDRDFCDRWRESGGRLVFAPDAIVRHAHQLSLRRFLLQHYTYGRGAVHLHAAREKRGVAPTRLEPLRFYWNLVAYPFRSQGGVRGLVLAALAALSQAAYAFGYYSERARRRSPRTLPG